jgi:recombination protein RecA
MAKAKTKKEDLPEVMTLDMLKAEMLKITKGVKLEELKNEEPGIWLTSPAYDLNRILSGDLFKSTQIKNHVGIVGPEASGKSSFMCLMLADAQKKGYLPVIIDAEGAWSKEFVSRWGLDYDNVLKLKTMWVEDVMQSLTEWINAGYKKLAIAIDSIGALDVKKLINDGEKGDIKADQGTLQKKIKRMLKMIVNLCKNHDCIAFSAGHFYGNPSGYGEPEQIGGGKYYRLSCDQIISLKKSPIFENPSATGKARGNIIGNKIYAATLKNRIYPPFQEAQVHIDYKKGVDPLAGIVDLASDLEIIIKAGSWYTCESLGIKAQGEAKLLEQIKDKDYMPMLEEINKNLKSTGYSSTNNNLEAAQEIINKEE